MATDAGLWTPASSSQISTGGARPRGLVRSPMESSDDKLQSKECRKILENLESAIEQFQICPR